MGLPVITDKASALRKDLAAAFVEGGIDFNHVGLCRTCRATLC